MIMRPAGQPKESYGDRSFQGIGKTTREAKQAAAKAVPKISVSFSEEAPAAKPSLLSRLFRRGA